MVFVQVQKTLGVSGQRGDRPSGLSVSGRECEGWTIPLTGSRPTLSMAWMQCATAVQRQQAKSLFHNVVTDLLVCQSLEMNAEAGPFP